MTDAGFTLTDGQSRRLNGLDAFVGTYTGVASGTRVVADAAHIRLGDTVYVVAGLAAEVRHARHSAAFAATIRSFRPLSAGEADRLQPDRLGFHVVRAGDTWESIARAPGSAVLPASRLAIMNGQEPSEPPAPGSRVRVVLGG
jgi:predicted Zn-dependent protease